MADRLVTPEEEAEEGAVLGIRLAGRASRSSPQPIKPVWPLAALAVAEIGAGLPPAAYAHYRDRFELSNGQVTSLFACVIIGVLAVLIPCRQRGTGSYRSRLLAAGLASSALADLVFAAGGRYPSLVVASLLLGAAVGLACAMAPGEVAGAHGSDSRASSWVTASNAFGLAVGPVFAALVNQLLPWPFVLVYLGHAAICLALAWRVFDRSSPQPTQPAVAPDGPGAGRLGVMAARGYLAFAIGGLVSSLTAVLVADEFGWHGSWAAGALIATFFAANALIGGGVLAACPGLAQQVGVGLLALGLLTAVGSSWTGSALLLVGTEVLAGGGQGVLIGSGIAAATARDRRSGRQVAVSAFFLWCYAGAASAALVAGWLADASGADVAFLVLFAVVVVTLVGVELVGSRIERWLAAVRRERTTS